MKEVIHVRMAAGPALGYHSAVKQIATDRRRKLFARTVRVEDGCINLALAALIFAADRHPEMHIPAEMAKLASLCHGASGRVPVNRGARAALEGLASYLHGEQGLGGDAGVYNSPAGSFLNEALRSHTGLPITLSVIYLEIGWRLGLPLAGVGLPGHFVIKYDVPGEELYCDPFNSGRLLTADDCEALVFEQFGSRVTFRREYLAAVSRRAILYRMLNNLKITYLSARHVDLALWATDRMVILQPESRQDIRDRGLLHYACGKYYRAGQDFVSYLMLEPPADEADVIRRQIPAAHYQAGLLN